MISRNLLSPLKLNDVIHGPKFTLSFRGQPGLDGREIGHYTQVVWATTTAVGCAAIGYTEGDPNTTVMPYQQLYVCNYGPPGNYIGSPVYIVDPNRLFATCPPTTTSPPLTINNSMGIFN